MKTNLQKIMNRILVMSNEQKEQFMLYFPHRVYPSERMIAILVSLSQLFMIISFLSSSRSIWDSPRAKTYVFLYLFLLCTSWIALVLHRYSISNKRYPLFMWTRRIYAISLCLWVIGITYLEQSKGQGITVFCYFLPCASAIVLLFPKESLSIFGITWVVMVCMLFKVDVDKNQFTGNLINTTFVTILTLFISYRYYQSTAKEFCDRLIIEDQYQVIEKKNEQLQQLLHLDQLTGLYNRRYLLEYIHPAYKLGKEKGYEGLIIMLDIDYFKKYNDYYGHVQGDECLKSVSEILKSVCKKYGASAIRYGGEEFMLVKFEEHILDATPFSEELIQILCEKNIDHIKGLDNRVTISIGVWKDKLTSITDIKDAIKLSDESLYKAKETGRNKIIYYNSFSK